jgi:amino acid transporter
MSGPNRSAVSSALAADRLGTPSVASFALTAAAPLMVVGGVVVAGWAATGASGFPLAFILVGITLAIFSVGYIGMAKRITNAGAFYSYIAQGLGKPIGVGASFVALLAYNFLQVGLYGIFGAAATGYLASKNIIDLGDKWWIAALVGWFITAILGINRVDINSKVLTVLLVAEVLVVLVWDVAFVSDPGPQGISFVTFNPSNLFISSVVGAVLVTVITAFVGFEAAPVFSEESKDSKHTIATATYLGLVVMIVVYALTSWATSVATGPDNVVAQAGEHVQNADLLTSLASSRMGNWMADVGNVLLLTSVFAAMLSYHNTVARYTFALAREGVLPRGLARTGLRSGAPQTASLLQTLIGLAVIVLYAVEGWDPLTKLFFLGGVTGGFGIMILLVLTSVAVIAYFARTDDRDSMWEAYIAPAIATVALGWGTYEASRQFAALAGVDPNSTLAWALPSSFGAVAFIGLLWALILRSSNREVYNAIGLGRTIAAPTGYSEPPAYVGGPGQ